MTTQHKSSGAGTEAIPAHTAGATAGPWVLQALETEHSGYSDWPVFCIRSGGGNNCLATVGDVDRFTAPRNEANARLMATAPELLAALRDCVALLGRVKTHDPNGEQCGNMVPDSARVAIAAATGRRLTLPAMPESTREALRAGMAAKCGQVEGRK